MDAGYGAAVMMTAMVLAFWTMTMMTVRANDGDDSEGPKKPEQITSPEELPTLGTPLDEDQVTAFVRMALANIRREFPNKPSNVMATAADIRSPSAMHPVFYGCFDWHSAVHGHWMLVRLLKLYPDAEIMQTVRRVLNEQFTGEKLRAEADYFEQPYNKSFERMYGWAWYFRLVIEVDGWDDGDGRLWRANLRPLEDILVKRTLDYLPKLSYPIRLGIHPDTAWGLGQALDYARHTGNKELEDLVAQRARDYYADDTNYPFAYEPSGEDFFSAGLNEADVMRRVMDPQEFSEWLRRFCPSLDAPEEFRRLVSPIPVSDPTDGKLVHLAGLDLSRGWTLQSVASALPASDPRRAVLMDAARDHARVGYEYVFSGFYEGDHWLATFAIYLHTRSGIPE